MVYTTLHLAHDGGVTVRTARRVLSDFFPAHEPGSWWRLSDGEYQHVLEQLKAARDTMPDQPRRVLHRGELRGVNGFLSGS